MLGQASKRVEEAQKSYDDAIATQLASRAALRGDVLTLMRVFPILQSLLIALGRSLSSLPLITYSHNHDEKTCFPSFDY